MRRPFAWTIVGLMAGVAPATVPAFADNGPGGPGWGAVAPLLDKHCARCHQAGKTSGRFKDRPAGAFGFVLDEREMVSRGKLKTGNAEGSEIFQKIVSGDMPKDIDDACLDGTATADTYCGMSKDEKVALHDAINALKPMPEDADVVAQGSPDAPQIPSPPSPPAPAQVADGQPGPVPVAPPASPPPPAFITDRDLIRAMSNDVAQATSSDAPFYRYLSLTHLVNAGERERDLRVYRMALAKLLNSLSTNSDPYRPVAVDEGQTLFRIDIRRLGWSPKTWDAIVAADPYVVLYNNAQFRALQHDLGTAAPFVRADWFVFAASRPPLYYTVLDLPTNKFDLYKRLGLDAATDFTNRQVERAGFQLSGVSDNNRMVERHAISTGAYWESYDFGSNGERKSLFQFPLGPVKAFGDFSDKFGFLHDGGEMIFNLPNGFHAYYLADGKGNRLDTGPTKIVRDPAQRDLAVTNGISCMGCHDKGIKYNDRRPGQPLDQVRGLVLHSATYPSEVQEIVSAIFPPAEEFTRRLDSDAKHYADSLTAAGVNMNTKADGVEMVNALSKRFEENLSSRLAAAEVGMTEDVFLERLDEAGGQAHDLKLRLAQDLVPRDQFVSLFAPLVNTISLDGDKAIDLSKVAQQTNTTPVQVAEASKKAPQTSKTFDLAFFANATSYNVGATVGFTLKSEQPCFLSLIDTDDKGQSLLLFPNGFHPDGKIEANTTIQIPGPTIGGFKIVAPESGTERITATCNTAFPDIQHDFSKDKFLTFSDTRSLIDAQTTTAEAVRLLSIQKTDAPPVRPGLSDQVSPVAVPLNDGSKSASQLVSNPVEPDVPITARKSLVIKVNR